MAITDPGLLSWAEAAVALGCSVRTLERLKTSGQIGYVTVGAKRVYFSRHDIDAYLKGQAQPASVGPRN